MMEITQMDFDVYQRKYRCLINHTLILVLDKHYTSRNNTVYSGHLKKNRYEMTKEHVNVKCRNFSRPPIRFDRKQKKKPRLYHWVKNKQKNSPNKQNQTTTNRKRVRTRRRWGTLG